MAKNNTERQNIEKSTDNQTEDKKSDSEKKVSKLTRLVAKKASVRAVNLVELKIAYAVTVVMVFLGDFFTKAIATVLHSQGVERFSIISGFLEFAYSTNLGMAAGKLEGARYLFIIPSIIVMAAGIIYLIIDNGWNPHIGIALSMAIGGGIGNMVERLTYPGEVVDFLFIVPFDFFPFDCIFNVADVFICVALGLFLFEFIKMLIIDCKKECNMEEDTRVAPPRWIVKFLESDTSKKRTAEDTVEVSETDGEDSDISE